MLLETSVSRLYIQQANFFEGLNPTTFFRSLSTQLYSSSVKKQLQGLNKTLLLLMTFPSDFIILSVLLKHYKSFLFLKMEED